MTLEEIGFTAQHEGFLEESRISGFSVGRVVAEHKERYTVHTAEGEYDAEITGNIRFNAHDREDFPAVGDWVAMQVYEPGFGIIHAIAPRSSIIKRQAVGHWGEVQIIAANVDIALLVQAADRDFSISRLERYLTICNSSGVSPVVILSKSDLVSATELAELVGAIQARLTDVPVIAISSETKQGYEQLRAAIICGKTYCMLGSSGVGKSTILNLLAGSAVMQTGAINQTIQRGRHITSHRELIVLGSGGILIDNPGMREVGITDDGAGIETTFAAIASLSHTCRYRDCTHTSEKGCAVTAAVADGAIDKASYENYLKLEREKEHFESSAEERRKKDKDFGKFLKNFKKDMKRNNQ